MTAPQALVISTPGNTDYVEYRQPIGQNGTTASMRVSFAAPTTYLLAVTKSGTVRGP